LQTQVENATNRLDAAEANLTALSSTMAAKDAMITSLQSQNDGQDATISALTARLVKLETWMMTAPLAAAQEVASCKTNECPPEVAADGADLALAATGGSVTFKSGGCAATDLCDLALDVQALKSKFSDQN
jgi:hypothetical protein